MAYWLHDLPSVLRKAGLSVVEVDGWQARTFASWSPGYTERPSHFMVHHTASKTTPANDINYIVNAPLSPIANVYLARDGVIYVIAAGRVVTNGKGSAPWCTGKVGCPPDNMMNHYAISCEAANDGVGEPWPKVQTDAYVKMAAAICAAYDIPVDRVRGHAEWAPDRKIDPAGPSPWAVGSATWDMNAFRKSVTALIVPPTSVSVVDNMEILTPPVRLLDTRTNNSPVTGGTTRTVALGANANCKAAQVTLTAVGAAGAGFFTAWGSGPRPNVAALTYQTGTAISNSVIVPVVNGTISVYSSQTANLIVDLYATWA